VPSHGLSSFTKKQPWNARGIILRRGKKKKKMAAVHFTTIPRESYIAHNYKEICIFAAFVPVLTKCMLGLTEILELLCSFSVADPHLELRERGRGRVSCLASFSSFCECFCFFIQNKDKGEARAPPLGPPLFYERC